MKMHVKRILCLAVAVMLCFSLAGCKELDYARAHHAVMRDDGTILLNGEVYVPLPYAEDFNPPMDWSETIAVTEPGIPVLLKDMFCTLYFNISEDGIIKDGHLIGEYGTYYCLEKDYAALAARIEAGAQMSGMLYHYSHWDPKKEEWSDRTYHLTEEQKNAVRHVLASVEPLETDYVDGEYGVTLEVCSEDGLFSRSLGELYRYNGRYAMVDWDEDGCLIYEAPVELNSTFAAIMKPYIDSEEAFYKSW